MYARITLLKTQIDEENIFVGTGLNDMYYKLRALTDKKEYIGSFNPNDPFRIGLNYFLLDRKFNYAIFELADTLEAFENRDIKGNEDLTRFYFIRGFEFVNDNVTRLIVKEDILAKQFYPIKNQTVKCIPSRFTYPDTVLNKRNFQAVAGSGLFNVSEEVLNKRNIYVPIDQEYAPDSIKGKNVCIGAIVVTYLDAANTTEEGGEINLSFYTENNTNYPFKTAVIPFCYNAITNEIISVPFRIGGYNANNIDGVPDKIISIDEAILFFKQTTAGFSVISSLFVDNIESLGFSLYYYKSVSVSPCVMLIANQNVVNYGRVRFDVDDETTGTNWFLSIINYSLTNASDGNVNNVFKKEFLLDYDLKNIVSPYLKITFELCGQKIEIDPRMLNPADDKITFTMFQSLVPAYAVTVDFLYDSDEVTRLNYSNRGCFKLENSNSFMSFLDSYTEFIRTNYNAKITGLSVQQSNQNAILASQQASEQAALLRGQETQTELAASSMVRQGINATAGTIGYGLSGNIGGAVSSAVGGLTGIAGAAVDTSFIQAGARDVQGITQAQQREALSLNQQKERAMLELQLQDLRNTPDQISISNSATLFLDMRAYARVTLWINERIDEIIFNHKIYGYSAPEMITDLKAHDTFDYIRTNNIIFLNNETDGFYPSTADMLIIQDTFSKGVRVWYKLDKIKDYDNINNGSV